MKRLENRLNVTDDEARVLALLAAVVMLGMVVFSFALCSISCPFIRILYTLSGS